MSSVVISGDTSGTVSLTVPAVAGTNTVTIPASTGTVALTNGNSVCKAWVNYNGATQTIRASYNVSSVTYNSAGVYTINFTTPMSNANYVVTGTGGYWNSTNNWIQSNPSATTINSVQVANVSASGAAETNNLQVAIFGG